MIIILPQAFVGVFHYIIRYSIYYPAGPHLGEGHRKPISFKGFPHQGHLIVCFLISGIWVEISVMTLWIKEMSSRSFSMGKELLGLRKPLCRIFTQLNRVPYGKFNRVNKSFWQDMLKKSSDKFHSCAGSFRSRRNQLWQIVFSKKGIKGDPYREQFFVWSTHWSLCW